MIDLEEIERISNEIYWRKGEGKNWQSAEKLIDAIKVLAESQSEIQKDLAWIKRKLNNEI